MWRRFQSCPVAFPQILIHGPTQHGTRNGVMTSRLSCAITGETAPGTDFTHDERHVKFVFLVTVIGDTLVLIYIRNYAFFYMVFPAYQSIVLHAQLSIKFTILYCYIFFIFELNSGCFFNNRFVSKNIYFFNFYCFIVLSIYAICICYILSIL